MPSSQSIVGSLHKHHAWQTTTLAPYHSRYSATLVLYYMYSNTYVVQYNWRHNNECLCVTIIPDLDLDLKRALPRLLAVGGAVLLTVWASLS